MHESVESSFLAEPSAFTFYSIFFTPKAHAIGLYYAIPLALMTSAFSTITGAIQFYALDDAHEEVSHGFQNHAMLGAPSSMRVLHSINSPHKHYVLC